VDPRGSGWVHEFGAKTLPDVSQEKNLHRDGAHHPGEENLFGAGTQEMRMRGGGSQQQDTTGTAARTSFV